MGQPAPDGTVERPAGRRLRRFDEDPPSDGRSVAAAASFVRDQRVRALLVNELDLPVDRVVDGRRTEPGDDDLFVTVDGATMRRHDLALFPAEPKPPAATPPARFRVIAAHGLWEAPAGPTRR